MKTLIALTALALVLTSCATVDNSNTISGPVEVGENGRVVESESEMIDIAGTWKGVLTAGAREIPLVLNVSLSDDGAYNATLDSPTEGVFGIPVESVTVDGLNVIFALPVTAAEYEAVYDVDADHMSGKWKQGGASLDLMVERSEVEVIARKPQEPVPPFPYKISEVAFQNKEAGITLGGTITFPDGPGPFPGVVLISGSGQQDRDEEVFGHRPFLVLADRLTRAGIAVLRYDDRGVGASEGAETLAQSTSVDFGKDAYAAHKLLRSLPGIDQDKIGLIGHSEGGLIAPALASQYPEIAFIVLLAGPGLPGAEVIASQSAAILKASGAPETTIRAVDDANRRVYKAILENPNNADAAEAVATIMKGVGVSQAQIDEQLEVLLSPWYRFFLAYDPIPALESLEIPVLALNGTLDLQVPFEANLAAISTALESAPTESFRTEALDGLNHLFQTASTGLVAEYALLEETFSPVALELVAEWITDATR
jgi:uncharacterized protein